MNVPAVALPPVIHLPIPILELICDAEAAECNRLGRILAALRSEVGTPSCLSEIVSAPTFEVITPAIVNCKHGLREPWCATCAKLSRSGQGEQLPAKAGRFLTMVNRQVGVKSSAGCAHGDGLGKRTITRVVSAIEDRSGYVWQNRVKAVELTPIEPGWGSAPPKFGDALSLAEYAARHRDDEAATLPHLPCYCDGCRRHVTVLHDSARCAENILAKQQADTERLEMLRKRQEQRSRAALIAQGLYSPEAFDREILQARRGTVEADLITKFDRDLSRKGNKYRIQ